MTAPAQPADEPVAAVPPSGLGDDAGRLWAAVTDAYALDEHELALLRDACRTVDLIAVLDTVLAAEGPVIDSPQGRKAHPAAVEVRQQRLALARLLSALRVPTGDEGDQQGNARQPRRLPGLRGVYAPRAPGGTR